MVVKKCRGFTLVELLVVIAIIALLMSILMPALARVKKQARAVACMTQLKQWALYFHLYTEDHDGSFMQGFNGVDRPGDDDNRWVRALGSYHKYDSTLACCPEATRPWTDENGRDTGLKGTFLGATTAWGYSKKKGWLKIFKGSYGINGWCNNPDPDEGHEDKPEKDHWRTPNCQGAAYVPLFLDGQRYNSWPEEDDAPPEYDGQLWDDEHMRRFCLNRHSGFTNALFMDWSVRKVGLKELWTLKWHKRYNTTGHWTKAGGIWPKDWYRWMWRFKDY